MNKLFALYTSLLLLPLVAGLLSVATGINPYAIGGALAVASMLPQAEPGALLAGVNKEIWIADILENFYPDWSFLKEADDMDSFVENNTINLAEAGADPDVLVNNTTYPIPMATRADNPVALPLDTLDTTTTVVRNIEAMEAAYDKVASVNRRHKVKLLEMASMRAAHAYAPNSNAATTPVLATTGETVSGYRKLSLEDVLNLRKQYDLIDAPYEGRNLILDPRHFADLYSEDKELFKGFVQDKPGFMLFSFKVWMYSKTPVFNASTGVKKAFGSAAVPATDTYSSVSFLNTEVMRAMGDVEQFVTLKDPDQKGDKMNYQMRFVALPKRQNAIGALYSARV